LKPAERSVLKTNNKKGALADGNAPFGLLRANISTAPAFSKSLRGAFDAGFGSRYIPAYVKTPQIPINH